MSRIQVNFRCDKMLRDRIYQEDNPSDWVRTACYQRLEREGNPDYLAQLKKQKQQEIKEIDEKLRSKSKNQEEISKLFSYHASNYKQNALMRTDSQRINWINRVIMKDLKRFGYTGSAKDVDDILLNWPED